MKHVFSLLFWAYFVISTMVLFWVAFGIFCLTAPFDSNRRALHRFSCWWGHHYMWVCPYWHSTLHGRDLIPNEAAMLVANHQSNGDVLLLYGLNRHFKWVSKSELFKVPFMGWNMVINQYVRLVRGDRQSIAKMMQDCRNHLANGSSIMMFPEGTRSRDGELRPFKLGAFSLAIETGVPIVPIVLDGTMKALPVSGYVIDASERLQFTVQVLPPISPDEFPDRPEALMEMVRDRMTQGLVVLRANTP